MRAELVALAVALMLATVSASARPLPAIYKPAQATRGKAVFTKSCAVCHGAKLQGIMAPALKGRDFRLMASNQGLTANTLRRFVVAHMPAYAPGSLSPKQYYEVTAFLLQENGFPAGKKKLVPNSAAAKRLYIAAFPRG